MGSIVHFLGEVRNVVFAHVGRSPKTNPLLRTIPPPFYPEDNVGNDGHIQSAKLSFSLLKSAANKEYAKYVSGHWDSAMFESFLKTQIAIGQVLEPAIN
jgi:hypothetical protein